MCVCVQVPGGHVSSVRGQCNQMARGGQGLVLRDRARASGGAQGAAAPVADVHGQADGQTVLADEQSPACTCTDDERSFLWAGFTEELLEAIRLGYKIMVS